MNRRENRKDASLMEQKEPSPSVSLFDRKTMGGKRKGFHRPIVYPQHLPIVSKRDEIVNAVVENQVVIISGETGSGKSTQIPKMCLEAGRGLYGLIGCTQPRRIAATTIAHRIAEELGEEVGGSVGYKIRFTDKVSPDAYIKIMTDGILLAEAQGDRNLYQYDTIIIDEAHERSVNIDFLLGLLKRLLFFRKDLKLIISSATLETEKFSSFFDDAPVIEVSGKLFPVEVNYWMSGGEVQQGEDSTYVDMALDAVDQIRSQDARGDILVFMPTEQDIIETCQRLKGRLKKKENVLPLFARLPWAQQKKIYKVRSPKVVVATNVAETSLTIPGIRYVVDTGLARISRYVPRTRTTSLPISPISQASAEQRRGRCGRVQRGVCIRLYSEEDFENRPPYTAPEILRSNLAEVILRMIYLGLGDIESFPFLDRPNPKRIKDGFDLLVELGAIRKDRKGVFLTDLGRKMARLPLDPRISRMLLEARVRDCTAEVAVIAAALSIQDPRERPANMAHEADSARREFQDPDSEFIGLVRLWNAYRNVGKGNESLGSKRRFCRDHFLSYMRMREWEDVHNQILAVLKEYGYMKEKSRVRHNSSPLYERIHKCVLSGFLSNIAVKKDKNVYQGTKGKELMIFPGSDLFDKGPEWIVAAEVVKTSRLFARTVARIDPEWIEEVGGDLCKRSYSNPRWSRARGEVVASEQVSLFGLIISAGKEVPYGRIDPDKAHEIFVRDGLARGNVRERFGFLRHNQELRERLSVVEHKLRKRGIIADEDSIAEFYSKRLRGVFDLRGLRKRIKEQGSDGFLRMSEKDLLIEVPEQEDLEAYPDTLAMGESGFKLSYCFSPGKENDGVTLSVPASMVSELQPTMLDWIVPGLLKEKVKELLKALPKDYRQRLVPLSHSADIIVREMKKKAGPLAVALSRIIEEKFDIWISPNLWSCLEIPEHLKLRISVVDHEGKEIVSGRGSSVLKQVESASGLSPGQSELWRRERMKWEREGLKRWDFGDLPEKIVVDKSLVAYPALEATPEAVNLRLYASHTEALRKHLAGVQSLCCKHLAKELRFVKRTLKLPADVRRAALYFGGDKQVEQALFEHLTRVLFAKNIREQRAFYEHLRAGKERLHALSEQLLRLCASVIENYGNARETLSSIVKANVQNSELLKICKEIESHIKELVPNNFLAIYDSEVLEKLPRYLKASIIRAQRAAHDPGKDQRKQEQLDEPLQYLKELRKELSGSCSEEKRGAIDSYRWMIEEFRVSVFAQELGTAMPVSLQRLRKKKEEIDRMI